MTEENLFVIDTDISDDTEQPIKPKYFVDHSFVEDDGEVEEGDKNNSSIGESCWNCGKPGHSLRECKEQIDKLKIAQNRKKFMNSKSGNYKRYHDDKFARFRAGTYSSKLREALGLKKCEIPMHVYAMRIYGYPPGWLAEAKLTTSGMNMYNSTGKRIPEPDEEEGEIVHKVMKYDVDKLVDYPGFNVPFKEGYRDEHRKYGFPGMRPDQSKEAFIHQLEEISARESEDVNKSDSSDMDIDNDAGVKKSVKRREVVRSKDGLIVRVRRDPEAQEEGEEMKEEGETKQGAETKEEAEAKGAPCPGEAASLPASRQDEQTPQDSPSAPGPSSPGTIPTEGPEPQPQADLHTSSDLTPDNNLTAPEEGELQEAESDPSLPDTDLNLSQSDLAATPEASTPTSSTPTTFGTPNIKTHSPYSKLPSFGNFGKNISDVIDFENLPDSVGKYASLCTIIDKVRQHMATTKHSRKSNTPLKDKP